MDAAAVGSAVVKSSNSARDGATLSKTFDTFLNLLTKQLQNQDPLDPVKSSEFTQQLVLFTNAEQAVATNKNLESLIKLSTASQAATAVGYIGKTVQADGNTGTLNGGKANWQYELTENANHVDVTITNSDGKIVYTGTGATGVGTHSFAWNGLDNQGLTQPDGSYTIAISAKNGAGAALTANTSIIGQVSGIETVDGSVVLNVGLTKVPLEKVKSVKETTATATI